MEKRKLFCFCKQQVQYKGQIIFLSETQFVFPKINIEDVLHKEQLFKSEKLKNTTYIDST